MEKTHRSSASRFLPVLITVTAIFFLKTYIDSQFEQLGKGKTVLIRQEYKKNYTECRTGEKNALQAGTEPGCETVPAEVKPAPEKAEPKYKRTAVTPLFDPENDYSGVGSLVSFNSETGKNETLELQDLKIRVTIKNDIAMTEIEQTFFNHQYRRVEGTFSFYVPSDASLTRLAMYVGPDLMEGELSEKENARRIYREITRPRRKDPALMEWVNENMFSTRIFPIPARGPKRIIINYVEPLTRMMDMKVYRFPLSNIPDKGVKNFEFECIAAGIAPEFMEIRGCPGTCSKTKEGHARFFIQKTGFHPDSRLSVRIKDPEYDRLGFYTHRQPGEDGFFFMRIPAVLSSETPETGRDLIILYDTSFSGRNRQYYLQNRAFNTIVSRLKPDDRLAVLCFDVEAEFATPGFISMTEQNKKMVTDRIGGTVPLGATDFVKAGIKLSDFLENHGGKRRPAVILMSDGIPTLGNTSNDACGTYLTDVIRYYKADFFSIQTSRTDSRSIYSTVSLRKNSNSLTLMSSDEITAKIPSLFYSLRIHNSLKHELPEIQGIETYDIFCINDPFTEYEELLLCGRYRNFGEADISLSKNSITDTLYFPQNNTANSCIASVWARKKLDSLRIRPQTYETRARITALSKKFSLMSPYTSFLVLENEAMYRQYNLEHLPRPYAWNELGRLKTFPPGKPEKRNQLVWNNPPSGKPEKPAGESVHPSGKKGGRKKPVLDNIDLSLCAGKTGRDVRAVVSSLGILCLEIYYRYIPIARAGSTGNSGNLTEIDSDEFSALTTSTAKTAPTFHPFTPVELPPEARDNTGEKNIDSYVVQNSHDRELSLESRFIRALHDKPGKDIAAGMDSEGLRRIIGRSGGYGYSESTVSGAMSWINTHVLDERSLKTGSVESVSLGLLVNLGAGHTHKAGQYRKQIQDGIAWLIEKQNTSGKIGTGPFEQALATCALCELYGMTKDSEIRTYAQKAVDALLSMRVPVKGRYAKKWNDPLVNNPVAVTCWGVIALKSAKMSGLDTKNGFEFAAEYVETLTDDRGLAGIEGPPAEDKVHILNTAAVMLMRIFMGMDTEDKQIQSASAFLIDYYRKEHAPLPDDMYTRWFTTMSVFQVGGNHWRIWHRMNREVISERMINGGPEDGSIEPEGLTALSLAYRSTVGTVPVKKALTRCGALPGTPSAYQELADILSRVDSSSDLTMLIRYSRQFPETATSLVLFRKGMLCASVLDSKGALHYLGEAYRTSGKADSILGYYTAFLSRAGRHSDIRDIIAADLKEGYISDYRIGILIPEIFRLEADPVGRLNTLFSGSPDFEIRARRFAARFALNNRGYQQFSDELYARLYSESKEQETLIIPYIKALRANNRHWDALELLRKQYTARKLTAWSFNTMVSLIMEPGLQSAIDPVRYIEQSFSGDLPLKIALYSAAGETGYNRDPLQSSRLFREAYVQSGNLERYGKRYVDALMKSGRTVQVKDFLLKEVTSLERTAEWRMDVLADIFMKTPRWLDRPLENTKDLFPGRPDVQAGLLHSLAKAAGRERRYELESYLLEHLYYSYNRPGEILVPYITSLNNSGDLKRAKSELEHAIRCGLRDTWTIKTISGIYMKTGVSDNVSIRSLYSYRELGVTDFDAELTMGSLFEKSGKTETAESMFRNVLYYQAADSRETSRIKESISNAVKRTDSPLLKQSIIHAYYGKNKTPIQWNRNDTYIWNIIQLHSPQLLRKELKAPETSGIKNLNVSVSWIRSDTDIDLRIIEPDGTECFYMNNGTENGGTLVADSAEGGPELYRITNPLPGEYRIFLSSPDAEKPVKATVIVTTNRDYTSEEQKTYSVQVAQKHKKVPVGSVLVP